MTIAREHVVPYIFELFESGCFKQFQSVNHQIKRVEEPSHRVDAPAAYIDAGSSDLIATLQLRIPKEALKQTYPVVADILPVDDYLLEDWLFELANRLLGRLKNKLLSHDCVLKMGLPRTTFNKDVDRLFQTDGQHQYLYFELCNEVIECHLSVNIINPTMSLVEYEDEDEDWFDESELEHLSS